jgi:single stranded DNA-binding protein
MSKSNVNFVQFSGFAGADATINDHNGQSVVNASIASTEYWTGSNGKQQSETTWLNIAVWSNSLVIRKGDFVEVEGRLRSSSYTDNAGIRRTRIELVGNRAWVTPKVSRNQPEAIEPEAAEVVEDEIPF